MSPARAGIVGIHSRNIHVTLEAVPQVANAIQMVAHRLADPARTDNDDVAHLKATFKAAVHHHPPYQPPAAEQHRGRHHGDDHHAARDHLAAHQVKRARKQQPRSEAGLDRQALFVQSIAHLHRAVQVITLADQNQRENEPPQAAKQDRGMVVEHDIGAVGRICSKQPFPKPAANRNHQGGQDDDYIAQNPQHTNPCAFTLGVRPRLDRDVAGPQFVPAVSRQTL